MKAKYQMNSKLLMIATLVIMCFGLIFLHERYFIKPDIERIDTVFQTDTFLKIDTLDTTIIKTIPKYIEKLKVDTVYDKNGDTIQLTTENKIYQDTLTCAKDSIILQSFISGIRSKRDSLKANWKRQETIITNTVEITKYIEQKKRFHIGPSFTAGYDPINGNFGMMIGVGALIDLY